MTDQQTRNAADLIGDHDPMIMNGGSLGIWVECECAWISPSYYSEPNALRAHSKHVEAVES